MSLLLLLLVSVPGQASRERLSVDRRVGLSELVIVGELGKVERRFSIVHEKTPSGIRAFDRHYFKTGVISIDEILMGELSPGESKQSAIAVALHDGFEKDGKHVTLYPTKQSAFPGDHGIWILKRSIFTYYFGFATYDCFLPIDSVESVKAAIKRVRSGEH